MCLQTGQYQRQLHVGEVLHFIDDNKVVHRLCQGTPLKSHPVQVIQLALAQPLLVALKQPMRSFTGRAIQQRLARPQRQVTWQIQRALHT